MVRVVITGKGSKGFTFAVNDDRGRSLDSGKAVRIGGYKYRIKFDKLGVQYEDYLTKNTRTRRIAEAYEFFKKHKKR